VHVTVAIGALLANEKALWNDEVQVFLRARHCDVQEPSLFFDFFARSGCHVGRNAAVDDVEHIDRRPLLALGRMHR